MPRNGGTTKTVVGHTVPVEYVNCQLSSVLILLSKCRKQHSQSEQPMFSWAVGYVEVLRVDCECLQVLTEWTSNVLQQYTTQPWAKVKTALVDSPTFFFRHVSLFPSTFCYRGCLKLVKKIGIELSFRRLSQHLWTNDSPIFFLISCLNLIWPCKHGFIHLSKEGFPLSHTTHILYFTRGQNHAWFGIPSHGILVAFFTGFTSIMGNSQSVLVQSFRQTLQVMYQALKLSGLLQEHSFCHIVWSKSRNKKVILSLGSGSPAILLRWWCLNGVHRS